MTKEEAQKLKEALEAKGVVFEAGLTDAEFADAEEKVSTPFLPDLKIFLSNGLPVSKGFPNWRKFGSAVEFTLEGPVHGILFDVEHNNFWHLKWPPRPASLQEAFKIVREELSKVPKLIPVYGHRFMPAQPPEEGNPVFSVVQTDIIYYGTNLGQYLDSEFDLGLFLPPTEVKEIEFWSDFAENRI